MNPENLLTFEGAFETRSNDLWMAQGGTTDEHLHFLKVEDKPNERRYRGVVSWQSRIPEIPMVLTARFGAERVQNFQFIDGNDRTNFLGEILMQVYFDKKTRFPRSYQ
jgi:hypothetical protein